MELQSARFLDAKCSLMEIKYKSPSGRTKLIQLTAPKNYEKGQSKYFDQVLEKYDIQELVKKTQEAVVRQKQNQSLETRKNEISVQQRSQNDLFKQKVKFLEKKIMDESTSEERKAIRKANTEEKFKLIQHEILRRYADKNNISFFDAVMLLDEKSEKFDE